MNTRQTLDLLQRYESPNVTFVADDRSWPIVWERARGVWVWDADGRKYLDLTAAFGVAAVGHANPAVVKAGQAQMGRLLHAMGDVHPHALKAQLARELSRLTFERWTSQGEASDSTGKARQYSTAKTIFGNSGFEAVEAALKTAFLATGKPGVVVFEGAYHGLGYGALNATHRKHFRSPFRAQLREFGHFVPFPRESMPATAGLVAKRVEKLLRQKKIGAVLLEPIQVRGGINVPPPEFLPLLREICDRHGALLILDEIYTGFGRTGDWFACEHSGAMADLICLGKALTGGFPLSACVGRAALMDAAWPKSEGEAIHTSTFLGHPVGCAMALAELKEIERRRLPQKSAETGKILLRHLQEAMPRATRKAKAVGYEIRGRGLLAGIEFTQHGKPATRLCLELISRLLRRGYLFLPEGEHANVPSFTPPLTISKRQIAESIETMAEELSKLV